MTVRLRWRLASLMDRLPGQCWAGLVSWALYGPREAAQDGEARLPWRPVTAMCRRDAADNDGCCYCGKYGANSPYQQKRTAAGAA